MKISLIGPTYPFRGGIAHYTTLLAKNIASQHELQFISVKRQYPKWLFPGKSDLDPSLANINDENAIRVLDSLNPFTWFEVIRLIRAFCPDILIIPWWVAFWAPPFWTISFFSKHNGKTKILFLCHNVVEHESNWLSRLLTKMVLTNGDCFIVHSDEDRNNLRKLIPKANVVRCHHPTYDVFRNVQADDSLSVDALSVRENVILFFGFVREYKGLKYLLEALPEVLKSVNVTLLVVGEFWKDKDDYVKNIKRLNIGKQVVLVDKYIQNEQVGQYFDMADIVVQPYLTATGSGVVQIAYGFEKPVIATRVGCLSQVVDDGKTGYLVEPANSSAIAQAVITFFKTEKKQEFAENIRKKSNVFSWEYLVNEIGRLAQ